MLSWTAARFGDSGHRLYEIDATGSPSVQFSLQAEDAESVAVVGGFTGWERVAMARAGDTWVVTLEVEPGIYRFGFEVDGLWYVPEYADGRTVDEWGIEQATLVVPEP